MPPETAPRQRLEVNAQERELKRLRERLQIAEATLQHYTGAANEAVA